MLRIAFAGTPEFALPALAALADSRHSLVGVLTQPDRPAGRGRVLSASPVKQFAQTRGVPVAQPARLRSPAERADLMAWQPELLVVVAYGLILPSEVLSLPRLGCLNIHASLLPRWRGAAPIQRALLAGDSESGVCLMQMDEGLDTGPVLAEERFAIAADSTAGDLHDALAELGARLLLPVIDALEAGRLQPRPQGGSGVTYAGKIEKREARIDWRQPAAVIERQVRAFNPWPVAETQIDGTRLRIWRARVASAALDFGSVDTEAAPGTALGWADDALQIRCGDGVLGLLSVQLPGRRIVTAREFAQGRAPSQLVLT
jgi:methionyl-tRNA formyltransferase